MTTKLKELQLELKNLVIEIKELKSKRKTLPCGYVPGLLNARYQARHKHVAYSLMLGNQYEAIEQNPEQPINKKYIEQIMEKYSETIHTSV